AGDRARPMTPTMTNTTERRPGSPNGRADAKRKKKKGADVIHVAFGNGGGRIPLVPTPAVPQAAVLEASANGREPVTDLFTRREVAKLLGVPEAKLKSLDRSAIVSPSGTIGKKRAYTFQDLIALRATRELLAHDVKLRDVAKAIGAL